MKNDPSASGRGIKRIEQQIRDYLNSFTSEAQDAPDRLKALIDNYSLLVGLGAIKVRDLAEHRTQFEFCRFVAVAVKLEHLGCNAT